MKRVFRPNHYWAMGSVAVLLGTTLIAMVFVFGGIERLSRVAPFLVACVLFYTLGQWVCATITLEDGKVSGWAGQWCPRRIAMPIGEVALKETRRGLAGVLLIVHRSSSKKLGAASSFYTRGKRQEIRRLLLERGATSAC